MELTRFCQQFSQITDIHNSDEFGLFSLCPPDRSYHLKNEKCSGEKHSELRITEMAAAKALGKKLRMFVIGKVKKSRCFKNVKLLSACVKVNGGMQMLCSPGDVISSRIIINFFTICVISSENQKRAVADEDAAFKEL